uniref:Calmodulin-binding domain-containing protein n=1 Tax=Aegilops tauschii TaxID=37682 RepID=R7W7U5_AEGTA
MRGRLLGSINKKQRRRTLLPAAVSVSTTWNEFQKQLLTVGEQCRNSADCGGVVGSSLESSMDDISSAFGGMNFQDAGADAAAATSQGNKLTMSRRRTPRGGERIRAFNPRAPNFLPVVPDPDAEKVDLRHQMGVDGRLCTPEDSEQVGPCSEEEGGDACPGL